MNLEGNWLFTEQYILELKNLLPQSSFLCLVIRFAKIDFSKQVDNERWDSFYFIILK